MAKKLKITHIASEVAPFSKTGGLGDVARSLPKALKRLGADVMIITPLYGKVINKEEYGLKLLMKGVDVKINSKESVKVNYWRGFLMEDLPVYFIESPQYFSKKKKLYGSASENAKFLVFSVAALKLLSLLKFSADIIHCHDWQTGLIPYYLKTDFRYSKTLKKAKTIFTIHNLIFQLGHNWWEIPLDKKDYGRSRIPHLSNPDLETINFSKRAILSADIINTVSETYRSEIMTKKFGQDLHQVLRNRESRLFGIVNGIDYKTYNPEKDPGIYEKYNLNTHKDVKEKNKTYLQRQVGLPENSKIPVLCTTSRVTFQKGFNLIIKILENLVQLDVQVIFMGDGSQEYIDAIKKLQKKYPNNLVWLPFKQKLETSLYAGSDFFLLPSNHEPCGINQLIAMRYGCIPIVGEVGGLYDTVEDYDPGKKRGNGFTFKSGEFLMFFAAIVRALETYKHKRSYESLVKTAMKESNSWEIPAKKYLELYKLAIGNK